MKTSDRPILVQINVSPGGIPKFPIPEGMVTRDGIEGDRQRNKKYHGGEDRAICLFSEELYASLREDGIDLTNGAIGENFTTRGLDLQALDKGDRIRFGDDVTIEITDVRVPCSTLKKWDSRFPKIIVGRTGWMARVLSEGVVKAGDRVEVLPRLTEKR